MISKNTLREVRGRLDVTFADEVCAISKVKNFLYWAINRSNFQEAIQTKNLHTFTNTVRLLTHVLCKPTRTGHDNILK